MMDKHRADQRKSSVDFALTALYMDILDGVYPPGSYLRLNEVAERLGVSMTPVRSAIRELAILGIVDSVPHKGAQVRELSIEDLVDTYYGRLHLESLALRLGAARFTEADTARAVELNQRRIQAITESDAYGISVAHEAFHFHLYETCGNPWILTALLPGWRNATRYRDTSMLKSPGHHTREEQHAQLIDAMADRDAERAVTILYSHLTTAAEEVAQKLERVSILDRLPALADLL